MKNMNIILAVSMLMAVAMGTQSVSAEFVPKKVTPADGSTVEILKKITVEWPGEWLDDRTDEVCGVVKDASDNEVSTITCEIDFMDPISYFNLESPVTENGSYTVVIYANSVLSDEDEWNSEFELHYVIGDEVEKEPLRFVEASPIDSSVVTSISQIETTWSAPIESINPGIVVELKDTDGNTVKEMTVTKSIFSSSPTVYLSIDSPLDTAGEYSIMIPEGLLKGENGEVSEAVELSYTVDPLSGVGELRYPIGLEINGSTLRFSGTGNIKVYGTDGTLIETVNGNSSTRLPKGIYILRTEGKTIKTIIP